MTPCWPLEERISTTKYQSRLGANLLKKLRLNFFSNFFSQYRTCDSKDLESWSRARDMPDVDPDPGAKKIAPETPKSTRRQLVEKVALERLMHEIEQPSRTPRSGRVLDDRHSIDGQVGYRIPDLCSAGPDRVADVLAMTSTHRSGCAHRTVRSLADSFWNRYIGESMCAKATWTSQYMTGIGENMNMDVVFPHIYMLWGLPHRKPSAHTWRSPSGLMLHGHTDHGVPFQRARIILMYLATKIIKNGQTIFGSLDEIKKWFELSWSMENLEKHFMAVVHSRFECTDQVCACISRGCRKRAIPVGIELQYDPDRRSFCLTVSDDFWRCAIMGTMCPISRVRPLVADRQLAALDLLVWYRLREHRHDSTDIDAVGPEGPFAHIKSAKQRFRKRDEIVRLHAAVVRAWPELGFHVSPDGNRIVYAPDRPQRIAVEPVVESAEPVAAEPLAVEPVAVEPAVVEPAAEPPVAERVESTPISANRRVPGPGPRPPRPRGSRAVPPRARTRRRSRPRVRRPPRYRPARPATSPPSRNVVIPAIQALKLPALPSLPKMPQLPELPQVPRAPRPPAQAGARKPGARHRATGPPGPHQAASSVFDSLRELLERVKGSSKR